MKDDEDNYTAEVSCASKQAGRCVECHFRSEAETAAGVSVFTRDTHSGHRIGALLQNTIECFDELAPDWKPSSVKALTDFIHSSAFFLWWLGLSSFEAHSRPCRRPRVLRRLLRRAADCQLQEGGLPLPGVQPA